MEIIRGRIPGAKKVVIYGPEGIGKSTFASRFPDPVFIDTEGSTKDMDVARFEKASSWAMLMEQIQYVKKNPDLCRTLVIDTADWAEQMGIAELCARHGKRGIEDFGYGNGYVYAKEEFGRFLNLLEDVVSAGINVVVTAHAHLKKFEQPDELGAYDRWELKLGKKTSSQTAPLLKEWADMVLFANYKTWSVASDKEGRKRKAQGGARVMYTSHHPCWDAKNRYGLPEELPFEYDAVRHIIEDTVSRRAEPAQHVQEEERDPAPAPAEATAGSFVQQSMPLVPELTIPETDTGPVKDDIRLDPRIPKALRDLMAAHGVCEWDVQNAVVAKGYMPADMEIWEYPEDFVEGCLVAAWPQVFQMIQEMKEKESVPFDE